MAIALLILPLTAQALPHQEMQLNGETASLNLPAAPELEADRLFQQGTEQLQRGQLQDALQTYQDVLYLRQTVGDRAGEAETLNQMGFTYRQLGDYEQALTFHQQALDLATTSHERAIAAESLHQMGAVYANLGNYDLAWEFYQQALPLRREVGDQIGEGRTLNNIGNLYADQGEYAQALQIYQQALTIRQDVGDRPGIGRILNNIGNVQRQLGNYDQALAAYQQAIGMLQDAGGDRLSLGRTHNSLGVVYEQLGEYDRALASYQQALTIAQGSGDRRGEGNARDNIGGVYYSRGDYAQALTSYLRALAIHWDIGNRASAGDTLNNLGGVYYSLGRYPQALYFLQQALATRQEIGDRPGEAQTLNGIGILYEQQEQAPQALAAYQQAFRIATEIGDRAGAATALDHMGGIYSTQAEGSNALHAYQQALAIRQGIGDRSGTGITLNNLALVYARLGQRSQALELLQQALQALQQVGDRSGEGITLSNLGFLTEQQNQPALAIVFYKQSVNVQQTIRQDLRQLMQVEQQAYTETVAGTYRQLAALLLSQKRILEAQQILELLKVEELRDYAQDQRMAGQSLEVALLPAEERILSQYGTLVAFGQQIDACEREQCSTMSQLWDERDRLAHEFQQSVMALEATIRSLRAQDDAFLDPHALSREARSILEARPNTVLIYPFVLEDRLWILWATPGRIVSKREVRGIGQRQLGETVLQFRQLLQDRHSDISQVQTVANQLYDWLIAPIATELQASQMQHLVFALDRVTRYIPMAALFDGERYLLENYTVTTILSAALTDMGDRLPPGTRNTPILAAGVSEAMANFAPLPNVRTELDRIVQENNPTDTQGIYPGLQLLNRDFTLQTLRDHLLGHKILHIATHGQVVPGERDQSYLLLGTGEPLPIPDIEVLADYLEDIHLVVLSACETALGGPDNDGIEIAGIGYSFLNGGAKAVIASLWQVNDISTSQLMQHFYGNLAAGTEDAPVTKSEALRQAQLRLLYGDEMPWVEAENRALVGIRPRPGAIANQGTGTSDFSHPYYWAPFILTGNGL
jgi:CHAT domain-containing protein/tetratricopeptide (TPR) repeat protein